MSVDSHASRPRRNAAQAISLLNAQVASGEELRRVISSAHGLAEISSVGPRLSSWSAQNERVLAEAFGQADSDAYRACAPEVISGSGFTSRQAALLRRVDARLDYLRLAVTRASQAGASKPRWRAFMLNPWVVGVGTALIVAALLAARSTLVSLVTGNGVVTGTVICESGRPVVGVWIAASTGQRDSGWAHLGANYPTGSTVTYSYQLGSAQAYSVHVGCGGTASDWASKNYSALLHTRSVMLHCDDPVAASGQGTSATGSCTPS
jgi:hypothetical protein